MKNLDIAVRSLFKKGRHNVTKIVSLSIGLAVALVLIARICFDLSFDTFYPDADRTYRLTQNLSKDEAGETSSSTYVPAAVAPGMKEEVPGIEAATRLTEIGGEGSRFMTVDKRRYSADYILMADSCVFDVLPRPVLSGNPKKVLAQPGYAMISRSLAEKLGGIERAEEMVIIPEDRPDLRLTIGGVFEDVPLNSHLRYDVLVSMESLPRWERNNWIYANNYYGYVLLAPGVTPESLQPAIAAMQAKHIDQEMLKQSGVKLAFSMEPMLEMHTNPMVVLLAVLAFALLFTAAMNYILIAISAIVNRAREIALMKTYGASKGDIHGLTMTETLVHTVLSLILAVVLIFLCQDIVEDLLGVSPGTLLFSKGIFVLLGICSLVFLITGFVPGVLLARIPVASVFRNFHENRRIWKLGLLFVQFTVACLLISSLVVLGKQYRYMLDSDPGYSYDRLAYCPITGLDPAAREKIMSGIGKLPEVEKVSSCTCLPLGGIPGATIMLPGSAEDCFSAANQHEVSNGFLDLMEIPIVEGRSFTEDVTVSGEVMVSRSFVERMKDFADWPDGPVGKQIEIKGKGVHTICGVYEDYLLRSLIDPNGLPSILLYGQTSPSVPWGFLLVKFRQLTPEGIAKANRELKELMPEKDLQLTLYSSEMVSQYSDYRKFRDEVMIGGLVTLLISLIGLIGYTNDEINRRRKEIAVRKINGATVQSILRIFLGDILRIAIPAALLGCGVSYYFASEFLQQFAEKISLNPLYFIGSGLTVCLIVVACVTFRTWKVANDDPVNSLKSE